MEQASRVKHDVAHSSPAATIGLTLTIVVVGVATGGVGSTALAITFGLASELGKAGGRALGGRELRALLDARNLPRNTDEQIKTGAATVFLDPEREPAAKAYFDTKLTKHQDKYVQEGSKTVLVERYYGARIGSKTACAGYVSWGSETIFYGGPTGTLPDPKVDENPSEMIDGGIVDAMDIAFGLYGIYSLPTSKGAMGVFEWSTWTIGAAATAEKIVGGNSLETPSTWAGRAGLSKDIGGTLAQLLSAGRGG
ncbi:MAG: hypothetical protein R3B72_06605 [Polyangiaceae bacterium]